MRTHAHALAFAGLLVTLPFVPAARTPADPPVTTGATVSSKPWVRSGLLPSAVLPVVTGGVISSKPWLANAARLSGASEEFVTLGARASSKPWIPNQWDRAQVEVGPLEPVTR